MVAQRISRFSVLAFLAIALWLFIFLIYYRYDFDDRIATYSNQPLLNPNHPAPPSAFVMLLRGRLQDAEEALTVLRSIEKQFNIEHQYPYVVFHENLSREAKQILENVVTAPMEFAQVKSAHLNWW
jgi:hypothetical protein